MHGTITSKVSIIIPTYNRANYILQTIKSIQQQTYSNWELIIVDDGSEDNTEEIISQLYDDRIRFIKASRIGIVGALKNIGLAEASGEFVAFNDSDDLWEPTKIIKQVHALQQYSDAGFCLTNGYNFKTYGIAEEYFYKQIIGERHDYVFTDFFTSAIPGFTQALMFRKSCVQTSGYFKEEKTFSDIDFLIRLGLHFKAIILFEPLVFRRLHTTNASNFNLDRSYYEGIEVIKEYKGKLPVKIFKNALYKLHINFGESYLKRNAAVKAISKFFTAWTYRYLSIVPLKKIGKSFLHLAARK